MTPLDALIDAVATEPSLDGALLALKAQGAVVDPAMALYRASGSGLELLVGGHLRPLPHSLSALPRCIDRLRSAQSGTTALIGRNEAEAPEFSGLVAHGLHLEGRLSGVLLTSRGVAELHGPSLRALGALLAARLRAARDALELRRLREERYEHLVRSETLAATGMLSAGVAHELNNPLGIVLGLAELLMLDDEVPQRVRADARIIAEETSRAVSVVRQLLSYGRGGGLDLEPAELIEMVESCVSVFESMVAGAIEVVRDYTAVNALVLCDPFRLQQAFTAILDNARKAVLSTGRPGRITIAVGSLPSGRLAVRFTDTGPGVDPAFLPRIFDPFFSTRELGTGTGMGLALVHRTLMDHGGEVRCESDPDCGASFVLELDRHRLEGIGES